MIQIYALINPLTNAVFYIGASRRNLKSRLADHVYNCRLTNSFKNINILQIIEHGLKPEIILLDTCKKEEANFWEEFYMELFKFYGFEINQMKVSCYHKSETSLTYKCHKQKNGVLKATLTYRKNSYFQRWISEFTINQTSEEIEKQLLYAEYNKYILESTTH